MPGKYDWGTPSTPSGASNPYQWNADASATPEVTPTTAAPQHDAASDQADYTLPAMLGTAAVAGGAYLLHRPDVAGKIADKALDLRQVSMLSGLAPLKSLLGNVGGSFYASLERGSLAPLREMLSSQTAKDAYQNFKAGPNYATAGPSATTPWWNLPGRVMGAMDEAAQSALQRAGLSSDEAAREMLQAPIDHKALDALGLNTRGGRYLVPFRRTPINQIGEGLKAFNADTLGKKTALATSLGTGFVSGAEAEDPKTIAITTAANGRYGVPHAIAAGVGRYLSTGSKDKGAQVLSGISPISDYSIQEGVLGPVAGTVPQPAAVGAYDYLKKLLGMGE